MEAMVVGWKKGLTSAAHTFVVDIGEDLWFGHLGKGGAFWEPGTPMMVRNADYSYTTNKIMERAGIGLGMAAGKKILGKFAKEIEDNYDRYKAEGRSALADSKKTFSITKAELGSGAQMADKMPGGPPALKAMGPFVKGRKDGKDFYLAVVPDSHISPEELLAVVQS